MATILLLTAVFICLAISLYKYHVLSKHLIRINHRMMKMEQSFLDHKKLPHFQSVECFQLIYTRALEGYYKSMDEISYDFSPWQMKKIGMAIKKNFPNGHPPELQ